MPAPLEGIRVLDFSHALAGPYCTMLLAQYGADVLKIEPPGEGEVGRSWGPPFTEGEASYFLGINAGKRGLAIDLKKPGSVGLCLRLIERADVLIENLRPGTFARLGLGWEAARARNPRLIYCSISGYGQNGPSRDDPAMDLIMQAASGLMSITGVAGEEPVRCGHSVADVTSGMFAMIGILMALEARHRTGEGQFVDISMFDSMISAMASNFAYYMGSGVVPAPYGSKFITIVPYGAFATADRPIVIAVASEKIWRLFCDAIDRPDFAANPNYEDNAARVRNRDVLEPEIHRIFRSAGLAHWLEKLRAKGVPCTPVRDLKEVAEDPQSVAREMFHQIGPLRITGPPVKLSATPGRVAGPAPRLGEHTEEVLREVLGKD